MIQFSLLEYIFNHLKYAGNIVLTLDLIFFVPQSFTCQTSAFISEDLHKKKETKANFKFLFPIYFR